jgi:hypothetical protein
MKPLKYTVAALAILAAASFSTSANAALANGSLVLGIADTTQTVTNSLEFNLGTFNTLSYGETWNLGTSVSTVFGSSTSLEFNIAGTGNTGGTGAAGGAGFSNLASKQLAFTAVTLPTLNGSNTTPNTDLAAIANTFSGGTAVSVPSSTSSNGTAFSAVTVGNSTTGSFFFEFDPNNPGTGQTNGQYALDPNSDGQLGDAFPTSDVLALYTKLNNSTSATEVGTFSLSSVSGNEILTFNTLATPEPSAYALGLCAVALFFVLRRRSTVA